MEVGLVEGTAGEGLVGVETGEEKGEPGAGEQLVVRMGREDKGHLRRRETVDMNIVFCR